MAARTDVVGMSLDEKGAYIRKVTWIGFIINVVLSLFKLFAGIVGHSQAMVADAVHSLSDTATDVAVLFGSKYWDRPPDVNHQYGHRRVETFITLLIGLALALVGVGIAWDALATMRQTHDASPGWIAAIAALLSIVSKEWLYRWTAAAGRRVKSTAVIANAWHHRSDAFSSIPVLVAVACAILFPALAWLDHVGALIVSVFIVRAAFQITWPGIREILDFSAPNDVCARVIEICLEVPNALRVHDVRTRYIGSAIQLDLHIVVDGSLTVDQGHQAAEAIRKRILSETALDIIDVLVHVDPAGGEDDPTPGAGA